MKQYNSCGASQLATRTELHLQTKVEQHVRLWLGAIDRLHSDGEMKKGAKRSYCAVPASVALQR